MDNNEMNEMFKKAQSMIQNNQIPDDIRRLITNNSQNTYNSTNNTQEKNGLFGSRKNKGQVQSTQFSNNVNDTLNRMRTNNF